MIECMKEVLYYESCKKIIIVVIYSLYFVDFMLLKNFFFFLRGENGLNVVNIYDEFEKNEFLKLLVIIEFKIFLFFLNVFFVEGLFDKFVFEVIFRNYGMSLKLFVDSFLILCYGICFMGGKGIVDRMKDFCKKLNINFCIVVDREVMMKDIELKIYYRSSFSLFFKEDDCSILMFFEEKF